MTTTAKKKNKQTRRAPRAAIYARSAVANPTAVAQQIDAAHQYARAHGFTVDDADVFVDDGVSGLTFDRPGFTELCVGIHRGRVTVLIVADASRLGREPVEVAHLLQRLRTIGVRVLSVATGSDATVDTPSSAFVSAIAAFVKEAR